MCLKSKVDKLDIGKLETTPVDLSRLSNVVKNDVFKKTEYNELVKKVHATDARGFVKKIMILRSLRLNLKYQALLAKIQQLLLIRLKQNTQRW